ncbi:neurotransmitter-gated ion-channel ligand-binding protein [Nitrosococcus watsonii]|uniref:Neurotransmitter-gated ion-channel ligand-binding protein n=1 Tax=Nitrosococcus watsoni (strain C-113) TaxID=105559 RepID=D8K493_NITWC|nr:neurotransmitter-gated ion-channel ligand-binding protein [Nitrosococcus watsonii]ADJ27790.1 neurotransmitter-gated ion-channel ligand-binding protein [Nitrosococcus watsonii C-113]
MMAISNKRNPLPAIQQALISFIFLLPAIGFCADGVDSQKLAESEVEKAVEKTAKETAAKEGLKTNCLDQRRKPTKVHFFMFILDIDAIDDVNQNFAANIYLRLRWKDKCLANPQGASRRIDLEEIWNPQLIIANRQGMIWKSLPEIVQVDPDGNVFYRQRFSGKLSQPLKLTDFPMDQHGFTIHFASTAYGAGELEFVPDAPRFDPTLIGGSIAKDLSLPDWKIVSYKAVASPYQPIPEIRTAGFVFHFEAKRYVGYYIWQVLLPLIVVVAMSWAGFWLERDQIGVRIGIATSSILTLIAHRFVIASLLPRLPYMTRMDYFSVSSTLLVFLALLSIVMASYLAATNRDLMAKRVDLWARGAFPAAFLLLLGWFALG